MDGHQLIEPVVCERWPRGDVRPSVRALEILAAIFKTTGDRLVDVDDLKAMPADRQPSARSLEPRPSIASAAA